MSAIAVVIAVFFVVIIVLLGVYLYNRYTTTPASPEGDLTRARVALMGSADNFQEAYSMDGAQMESYTKGDLKERYPQEIAMAEQQDAASKKRMMRANPDLAYGKKMMTKQDAGYGKKMMAQKRGQMNMSADPEEVVEGMRTVWQQMGQEIDNLDVDCAPPQHMMQLKKRLMDDKEHLSEMNRSCLRDGGMSAAKKYGYADQMNSKYGGADQMNSKYGGADRAYPRRARSSKKGSMDKIDCDEFGYEDGAYCLQDTPAGKKCYRSGNNKDGSKGWYEEADMEMCEGRPSCGDVMRRCKGYDVNDY